MNPTQQFVSQIIVTNQLVRNETLKCAINKN